MNKSVISGRVVGLIRAKWQEEKLVVCFNLPFSQKPPHKTMTLF